MPEGNENTAHQGAQNGVPVGDQHRKDNEKEDKGSLAQKIIDFVMPKIALFHSPDGKPYASYKNAGHCENHAVDSKPFRLFINNWMRLQFGTPPGRYAIDTVLSALEAAAISQYEEVPVYHRYARVGDEIFIDLGNKKWDAVRVTAAGWEVVGDPPVRFVRHKNMAPLPYPSKTPDLSKLRGLINVSYEADWILIVAWLIAAMSGIGPYAILLILAPQGSAKSALTSRLVRIIDPVVRASIRSMWRNEWDLAIHASKYAVLAFDNISKITAEQSDAACRLATGSGFGTRELWTKEDETLFDGMRPLIFNGISDFATRPDLLERSLIIVLSPITPGQRRPMSKLDAEFERHWPDIFAGLLDALSAMLKNMPEAQATVEELPRMADFALVAIAAEPACPWEAGAFLDAYKESQGQAQAIAVESDPFAQIMLNFAAGLGSQKDQKWNGTATELLQELKDAPEFDVRDLPASPSALSGQLRRLQPVLEAQGLYITFKREGAGGNRTITLSKKPFTTEAMAGD